MDADATLGDAITYVKTHQEDGIACPCCGQLVKVYQRKLNANMAAFLVQLYFSKHHKGAEWAHYTDLKFRGRDYNYLAHFGLAETDTAPNAEMDGTSRKTGNWRITPAGKTFVEGRAVMSRVCLVLDNHVVGFTGEKVTIHDALGDYFNYSELMAGVVNPLRKGKGQ